MTFSTPDLCDAMGDAVRVAEPVFRDYGGVRAFAGAVETLRVFEDNALVRATLETPGDGRVLVVDGGGSLRTALVGGNIAALAAANGWSGLVVYGAVRDVAELAEAPVGIKALAASPRRSAKAGAGARGVRVSFAGISIEPGNALWADADGVLVADRTPQDFQG
ncbi:MAG TPA: ribonuclease E activity regulator RraA [Gemmatimonadales bacterium]|nr:ribonuclease E activity regulator RraA [Gemmatimonadales bacterium]